MTLAILSALVFASAGTWLMIRIAPALQLVDSPNERSSHNRPTARGGGVAIVIAVTSVGLWAIPSDSGWWLPLIGAIPIAAIGLLDDRFGLSIVARLCVQLIVSLACAVAIGGTPASAAAVVLGGLTVTWACNLYNFMDGIDGMAGTEAFFICAAASWLFGAQDSALGVLLGVVAASSAGFLLWNWSPAKIFMGDVGSAYLGFLIATIAFATVLREPIALPTWIILWTLFLADTAVALLRRMLRGERWWMAHRSHAYQHLSRRFSSHALVTVIYGATNLIFILPSAWYSYSHPHEAWWVCGLVFSVAMALAYVNNAGQKSAVST